MTKEQWENIINDSDSYKKLYADYYRKFFNYGKKFSQNNALIEDSIQDAFLDIWVAKERLARVNSVPAYLFSVFRYTLFRKIKVETKIICNEDLITEPEFSIDHMLFNQEVSDELQLKLKGALNALTAHQREAIFLRFYQNLSYEEVSVILNISVKATYKIMARSLSSLKDKMFIYAMLASIILPPQKNF